MTSSAAAAPVKAPASAPQSTTTPKSTLTVRIFDAGHGDGILLRTSSGHVVLIDAGRGDKQRLGDNLVKRRLLPYFRKHKISHLDAFIITHPHWDHYGDPQSLARGVRIKTIFSNTDTFAWLPGLQRLAPTRALSRGDVLRFGELTLEVLNPPKKRHHRGDGIVATNNRSLVLRARFGAHRLLFAGDLMFAGERELLRRQRKKLRADVLKLGHHGVYSSSARWLRAVRPRWAIATCGERWGKRGRDHLSSKLLRRLRARRTRLLRTDRHGDVLIRTDGRHLEVLHGKTNRATRGSASEGRRPKRSRGRVQARRESATHMLH